MKEILDAPPPATAKKASGGRAKVVAGVLVVLAVLFAAIYVLCIQTKPLTVTVERAVWVKALHIERLDTERKEAWHEQVPSGARELRRYTDHRSKRVQVGTEKVKTGKKDLGNGYFEDIYTERPKYEDREVEDTKVVYEIDRWVQDRTIKNESSDGREPDFPQFLSTPRSRIGRRESAIALELAGDNKKSYHYDVDLEAHPAEKGRVLAYGKGKSFTAFVNVLGVVTRLEPR